MGSNPTPNGASALLDRIGLKVESDQFLHLDALRFLASSGIVAFHYQQWIAWPAPPLPLEALFGFGQFVDLFFVISGIVITQLYRGRINTSGDYRTFLRKRVARLLPLHWLTLAFFCAIGLASTLFGNGSDDDRWSCLLPNILLVHAFGPCAALSFNTPSWSISAEMAMYVALPAVLFAVRRPGRALLALGLIVAGLALLNRAAPGHPWYARTYDLGVLRAAPAFLFGAILATRRDLLARIPRPGMLMWFSLALFWLLRLADAPSSICLVVIYLVPLFGLAADGRRTAGGATRALAPLGQLTYSMYMLHIPIAWVMLDIGARRAGLWGASLNAAVLITGLVVVPILSILSLRFFETPMRRWITAAPKRDAVARERSVATSDFAP